METRPPSKRRLPATLRKYPIDPIINFSDNSDPTPPPKSKKTRTPTKAKSKRSGGNLVATTPEITTASPDVSLAGPASQAQQMAEFRALTAQIRQDNMALINRITSIEAKVSANATATRTAAPSDPIDISTAHPSTRVVLDDPEVFQISTEGLSTEGTSYAASVLEVGSLVSANLKAKIRQLHFVDFRGLLPSGSSDYSNDPITISFANNPGSQMIVNNQASRKKDLTMSEWLSAWNIFLAIMGDVRPDIRPAKLCKHFQQIQRLHQARHDWHKYDTEFRRLIELNLVHWCEVHFELLQLCQVSQNPLFTKPQFQPQRRQPVSLKSFPKGFCFKFHSNSDCRGGCGFDHSCFNCGFAHSFSACKKPINRPFRMSSNRGGNPRGRGGQSRTTSGPSQSKFISK